MRFFNNHSSIGHVVKSASKGAIIGTTMGSSVGCSFLLAAFALAIRDGDGMSMSDELMDDLRDINKCAVVPGLAIGFIIGTMKGLIDNAKQPHLSIEDCTQSVTSFRI